MNIEFHKNHIDTLCELKALAEKHGCRITFGVDSWSGVDPEFEEFSNYSTEVHNELNDKGTFSEGHYEMTRLWFEFCDPNNPTRSYHQLQYSEGCQIVTYEPYFREELSEQAEEFLENNDASWDYATGDTKVLEARLGGTTITGFEGLEHPTVYRAGMALKFFGDLVCDYLKEERIVRVY